MRTQTEPEQMTKINTGSVQMTQSIAPFRHIRHWWQHPERGRAVPTATLCGAEPTFRDVRYQDARQLKPSVCRVSGVIVDTIPCERCRERAERGLTL